MAKLVLKDISMQVDVSGLVPDSFDASYTDMVKAVAALPVQSFYYDPNSGTVNSIQYAAPPRYATVTEQKTPEQILEEAAKILAEQGWTQGTLQDREGHLCALGSLQKAAFGIAAPEGFTAAPTVNVDAYLSAAQKLLTQVQRDAVLNSDEHNFVTIPSSIPEWNDRDGRSAEDVILAMKRVAHGD